MMKGEEEEEEEEEDVEEEPEEGFILPPFDPLSLDGSEKDAE